MDWRHLFGLHRQQSLTTRPGQPLRPWTLPNAVGLIRLGLVGLFLVLIINADGHSHLAVLVLVIAGLSDYLDGFLARLTGQYSRLGALLDPAIDRILVASSFAICLGYQVLPSYLLLAFLVREALMFILGGLAAARNLDLSVNWAGRFGISFALLAPVLGLLGVHPWAVISLLLGLGNSWLALGLYLYAWYDSNRSAAPPKLAQPS